MRPSPGSTCREIPLHELLVNILGGILATLAISIIAVMGGSAGTGEVLKTMGSVLLHSRNQLVVTIAIALLIFRLLQKISSTSCKDDKEDINGEFGGLTGFQNGQRKSVSIVVEVEDNQEDQNTKNKKGESTQSLGHKARKLIHVTIFF